MCGVIEAIDATTTVANLIISASEIYQAGTSKAESEFQADQLVRQAKNAEQNAAYERQEGIEEARRQRLQAILNMGEQKTNIASGNIALSSEMALNLVEDEKLNGELDALTTLKESERRAESYMQSAQKYYEDAALVSFKAKNAFTSTLLKQFGNTTKSNTNIYSKYFKDKK